MKMDTFDVGEYRKFLFTYDVSKILKEIPDDNDPIWDSNTIRQSAEYWGFHNTRSIIFKWCSDPKFDLTKESIDILPFIESFNQDTQLWKSISPFCDKLAQHFNGIVVRAFIANIPPGSSTTPHEDIGCILVPFVHRNHVALETREGVDFLIKDKHFKFEIGDVYEIDNMSIHDAINNGKFRRLHLIVDVLPQDFKSSIIDNKDFLTVKFSKNKISRYKRNSVNGRIEKLGTWEFRNKN